MDDRWHTIDTGILWNWTKNRESGVKYYNQQRSGAQNHLEGIGHLNTPAAGQTRNSMIDIEGYAKYNGGPYGQFWEWVKPAKGNPIGYWTIHATHLIKKKDKNGTEYWKRVNAPVLKKNVSRYKNNY